jgi:hypothetical protein
LVGGLAAEDISRGGEVLEREGEKPFNFRLGGDVKG